MLCIFPSKTDANTHSFESAPEWSGAALPTTNFLIPMPVSLGELLLLSLPLSYDIKRQLFSNGLYASATARVRFQFLAELPNFGCPSTHNYFGGYKLKPIP